MWKRNIDLRELYFPQAEGKVFSPKKAGFAPLPIIHRKLIRYLTAPEFRVLTYLIMRIGPEGICYPTYDEMTFELDLVKKNLQKHLNGLAAKKFIERAASEDGKLYFLVYDPREPIRHLVSTGVISQKALVDMNALLVLLKQEPIVSTFPTPAPVSVQQENAEPAAGPESIKTNLASESVAKESPQSTPVPTVPICSKCQDQGFLKRKGYCTLCDKGREAEREYKEFYAQYQQREEAKRKADQSLAASSGEPAPEQKPNPTTVEKREQSTNTTRLTSFYCCHTCRDKGRIEGNGYCPDCREGESWRSRDEGMCKKVMDDAARHEKFNKGRMVSCSEISISFDGPARRSA